MEDQNKNMIPDHWDRLILRIGGIVTALLGAYATALGEAGKPTPLVLGLLVTGIPLALTFFSFKGRAGVSVLLPFVLALFLAGCGNLASGYRAVTVTVKAGNETGKTVAGVCQVRRNVCLKEHSEDVQALRACLKPCHRALTAWTTVARPAINSATEATFAALETARAAKRSDSTWVAKLRPGVCALVAILREWRPLLKDKAEPLLALLGTVEDIACSK